MPGNILKITLSIDGHTVSSITQLDDDLVSNSRGPMSLYSACLGCLRETTQSMYARAKAKQWNNIHKEDSDD